MPKKGKTATSGGSAGLSAGGAGVGLVAAGPGVPAKRPVGRQPGQPRPPGAGRKKGVPNRLTTIGRNFIVKKSMALPFLCDVSAGRRFKIADPNNPSKTIKVYPTTEQRLRASAIIAPMIVPTLKAIELGGPDGAPIALTLLDFLRGLPE